MIASPNSTNVGPILFDVAVNGRPTRDATYPIGNRAEYPDAAPQGVCPAAGKDSCVAINVFNESAWLALVRTMDLPAWTSDPRFATQADRFAHQDALDTLVGAWTQLHDRHLSALDLATTREASL